MSRSRIKELYSSKATVFHLGIKMHFVRDYHLLTNSQQAKVKAECSKAHQEHFLNQMKNMHHLGDCGTKPGGPCHGSITPAVNYEHPGSGYTLPLASSLY